MATLVLKLLSLWNVVITIFLNFIPQKLRLYLPCSWYSTTLIKPQTTLISSKKMNIQRQRLHSQGLRRSFEMFDRDGDGRITEEELRDSLGNLGIFVSASDLKRVIDDVDSDGDGCIDFSEFGQLYGSIVGGHDDDDEIELVREAFDVFDLNGDGFITVDELWSVMGSLGIKQCRAADDCRKMISKVDCDGDGRVSFDEFKQMLKDGGFAALD